MNRNFLRGFLQIGFFVGGGGFLLAYLQPPDSPVFVISMLSGILGLALVVAVVVTSYFMKG